MFRPFRGLRYNPRRVSIEKVVTQPYDKISREMQDRYYALDPHNIIRVILGRSLEGDAADNNVYTRAAATLREWRTAGVIEPMPVSSFVACFQRFTVPGPVSSVCERASLDLEGWKTIQRRSSSRTSALSRDRSRIAFNFSARQKHTLNRSSCSTKIRSRGLMRCSTLLLKGRLTSK